MGGYVSVDLVVGEEVRFLLDDDVLHTAHVLDLPGVQVDPLRSGVASQPQRVAGELVVLPVSLQTQLGAVEDGLL